MSEKDRSASSQRLSMKRRGLLRLGTAVIALTSASALSAAAAHAGPGDKNPPNSYVPTAEKGAPSGVATLDDGTKIPHSQLPDLSPMFGTFLSPRSFGAVGDGVSDDYSALSATLQTAVAQTIIDLGGRTFALGQTMIINKTVTIRNGTLTCAVDRVASVLAEKVRLENVQFVRTGPTTSNNSALTLNAANCLLIDVIATSTCGEALRMGNGACNGTQVRGGYFASSDRNESTAIHMLSGPAHNYDVTISGATVRHTGYGTGIGLYNCSRSAVERCDVRGIRRSPILTLTGWSLVSGTVYKTRDRTDVPSNAVYVNDTEYRKNPDPSSVSPALNHYTVPGDGYLYLNTGVNPSMQTVKTTRTNGYGIMFYATRTEAIGMRDNLVSHNYVEDTDGFGIYYQTLMNIPRNNRTLQNTLRNVCLTGVTVNDLPFAGIGVFGGLDVQMEGDMIDGAGSAAHPAPGVDFKASIGTPHMTASISGVVVKGATSHGISLGPGTWRISGVAVSGSGGSGLTHGTIIGGDVLDATIEGCAATDNAANGAYFETTSIGEIRLRFIGGRYTDNAVRNIALGRCRDAFIGGGLISANGGKSGINLTGTNQRIVLDGLFLRGGLGITVAAGIGDLTINNVISDGSAGTKLNVAGPYKVGGITGYGTDWCCVGSPEGLIAATVGSRCIRTDGGPGTTFYVKESGAGNVGWNAK